MDLGLQNRFLFMKVNLWHCYMHRVTNCTLSYVERCFKCNLVGHFARDCPEEHERCYNCNKLGHIAKDCTAEQDPGLLVIPYLFLFMYLCTKNMEFLTSSWRSVVVSALASINVVNQHWAQLQVMCEYSKFRIE